MDKTNKRKKLLEIANTTYMKYLLPLLFIGMIACKTNSQSKEGVKVPARTEMILDLDDLDLNKIEKSKSEWKSQLTEQEYYVLREKGTERAFTGDLLEIKDDGVYVCAACQLPLFSSDTKYKSGTGWPSYYRPIKNEYILEDTDYILGYPRTEVMCARCEGHLGHVFKDGPEPTGLRYCINSVSLDFVSVKDLDQNK